LSPINDFQNIAGQGVKAKIDGNEYFVGNERLIKSLKFDYEPPKDISGTVVFVANTSELLGYIILADAIKKESYEAVKKLHSMRVKVAMLTGDSEGVAKWVSSELGLDEYPGMWQSILANDLDGDGNHDLLAGNFGTNSRMQASPSRPLSLLIKDFNDNGYTSGLVTIQNDGKEVPFEQLDELLQEFPQLTQNITSYEDFASRSVTELLGEDVLSGAERKEITELRSVAIFNRGNMQLDIEPLPVFAQSFPINAFQVFEGFGKLSKALKYIFIIKWNSHVFQKC
jgi:magnesium-transporting ATPase (P-type)